MEVLQVQGALYPVCIVKGDIPKIFFDCTAGISHLTQKREDGTYTTFPFWHLEELSKFFGEPQRDYGKSILGLIRKQYEEIEKIRSGESELLKLAPAYFYEHQKKAWALCVVCKTFNLFLEPGLGKTAIMIEIMRMPSRKTPTLIVCPSTLIRGTWIPELKIRAPELRYINLQEFPELASTPTDIYLINKEKLVRRRNELTSQLRKRIGRVIIDESSMLKNPESKITKAMCEDYGSVLERYNLSGTPAPNGPQEYWGQLTFTRPGLLPVSFLEYMKTWFDPVYKDRWKIKPDAIDDIMNRISRCSIFMSKKDCLKDMPDKNFIVRNCVLPDNVRKAYNMLRDKLRQQVFDLQDTNKKTGTLYTQVMRLREITSGFIVTSVSATETKWNLVSTHKFQVLEELLEEIGNKQVVIWMQFRKDFEAFHSLFPQRRQRAQYIFGDVTSQDLRSRIIKDFQDGNIQYLLANPASLGHGVTLIHPDRSDSCSNVIYLDLDYSLEKFLQSQDRVHRIGQKNIVNYYSIICENTIDEVIWNKLSEKKDTQSDAMEYLK